MIYSTYFEIGGHVLESYMDNHAYTVYGPGAVRPPAITPRSISKQTGVPTPLIKQANREIRDKTGYDVMRASQAHGRFRRARWAAGVAAALVMADGPLPVGDALAAGFLGAYATYEIVSGAQDLIQ